MFVIFHPSDRPPPPEALPVLTSHDPRREPGCEATIEWQQLRKAAVPISKLRGFASANASVNLGPALGPPSLVSTVTSTTPSPPGTSRRRSFQQSCVVAPIDPALPPQLPLAAILLRELISFHRIASTLDQSDEGSIEEQRNALDLLKARYVGPHTSVPAFTHFHAWCEAIEWLNADYPALQYSCSPVLPKTMTPALRMETPTITSTTWPFLSSPTPLLTAPATLRDVASPIKSISGAIFSVQAIQSS